MYAPKSYAAIAAQAVRLAGSWLVKAHVGTSEERNMRLMGMAWAGVDKHHINDAVRDLVAQQRTDGGWAQLHWLQSDAYATGQALVALREAGMAVRDPAYRRGVQYLLDHQMKDGSWWVRTRSIPTQTPFDSGFPHGVDQWISAAATNWSTIALAHASKDDVVIRRTTEPASR